MPTGCLKYTFFQRMFADRELRVNDALRKNKIAAQSLTSVCSCSCHSISVLVGVQFHWIFCFVLFFFSIVFVPMVENGSWSMTFEEVSYLSVYVCDTGVCLSEKCSILLPKVTNQTRPAVRLLLGGGELTTKVCFLLEWCPWRGWRTCPPGQCEFPGLWKPCLLLSFPSRAGGGCLLC